MAVLLTDTFTGAEGDLAGHTSDSGHSWAAHEDAATAVLSISNENRVRPSSGANALYIASLAPATADYEVVGEIDRITDSVAAPTVGIAGRVVSNQLTYYMLRGSVLAGQTELTWTLTKFVNTVNTTLGTWVDTDPFGAGDTREFTLRMVGDQISALIDGTTRITATDASIAAAGRIGIRGPASTVNNGVGTQLDRIVAQDPVTSVPTNTTAPTITGDGTPQAGETLTAGAGTWTNGPITSRAYRFETSDDGVSGWTELQAKSSDDDYTVQPGDGGKFIRVAEWASNAVGESAAPAFSTALEILAPIAPGDVEMRLSGGASNTDPVASIGGAISSSDLSSTPLHNLFDRITGTTALAGQTDYRLLYLRNDHPTDAADFTAYVSEQIAAPDKRIAIGVATQAAGQTVTAIANRFTAPAGVTFSAPTTPETGVDIGTLDPGEARGLWVRRIVDPGADPETVTFELSADFA